MKQKLSVILCIFFLTAVMATAITYNSLKPRVMVVQSYDPAYAWTRDVDAGLHRIIDQWTGYSVTWHYMDTKKLSDKNWLKRAGIVARRAVQRTNPRVLITVDDLAQSLVGRYFIDHPTMDIVFAGVNGSVEPYGYHLAGNVTGIYERKQLKAVKETILALESKKDVPNPTPALAYVLDPSPSLGKGKGFIDDYAWYPVDYKGSIVVESLAQWKKTIKETGKSVDYIIVANYRKLHTQGPDSPYADAKGVMAWTDQNSPVPVIGINAFNVEDGAMISIGVSPFEQGETAARMAQEILTRNIRAREIPMKMNTQYIVAIREASLQLRNMELPAIYEAFGRATENYIEER